ncbi:MAG: protein phosphatase 2C domain-containing protein [Actinomycetaceae bacterium]|nr:protein phosphatase 2C domain-containing protein [Actinomycetaceae bacterium]MDO5747005.1 protein phosphatase 2C domain-containing protein [Actinomycetaceae bacterium]
MRQQPVIWASSQSDVGSCRTKNEDAFLSRYPVFLVADGMGGHGYGDRASNAALAPFQEVDANGLTPQLIEMLYEQARCGVAALSTEKKHPGTTLTGAFVTLCDQQWVWRIINIGDSRTYCYFEGKLRQITKDHSRVQELIDYGIVTPEQARQRSDRNIITRALGASKEKSTGECDYFDLPMQSGQRLLICSDGLTGELNDHLIASFLRIPSPQLCCSSLVDAAKEAGGKDNITVTIVDVGSVPSINDMNGNADRYLETDTDCDNDDTRPIPIAGGV